MTDAKKYLINIFNKLNDPSQFKRLTAIIFGIAVIVRIIILLGFWQSWDWQTGSVPDSWNKLAINLVDHGVFGFVPEEPTMVRGPIFPLLEVPLYLLFGENYLGWSIMLLLFDSFTCLLLILLVKRLKGQRPALLAGLFYALNLAVAYYTIKIEQLTSMLPLVVLWLYLMSLWDEKRSFRSIPFLLGIVSGIMILNKSVYLPLPAVSIAALIAFNRKSEKLKTLAIPVLIYLFTTLLVLAPWAYRNYRVSGGKFVPAQTYGQHIFWQDMVISQLDAERGLRRPAGEALQHILKKQNELLHREENKYILNLKGPQKELEMERAFSKATIEWYRHNPVEALKTKLDNIWQFWIGAENQNKILLLSAMQFFFLGAALVGVCLLFFYRQIQQVKYGLILVLMLWCEHIIIFAWGRFSLDLVPILAIFFGLGLETWIRNKKSNSQFSTPNRNAIST